MMTDLIYQWVALILFIAAFFGLGFLVGRDYQRTGSIFGSDDLTEDEEDEPNE